MASNLVYSSVDPNAPEIRGYANTTPGFFEATRDNFNAWYPKWGANTINAAVTGVFSALSTIAGTLSANKIYKLYEQQEQLYIENAAEEARRLKLKGDIELRNLEIQHAVAQGTQEMTVAAMGGNLSGSALDMLTQNYKYDVMDERTSSLNTLWEVSNAKQAGYINAIQTAGQAMTLAYGNRNKALAGLGSLIKGMALPLLRDQQQYLDQDARFKIQSDNTTKAFDVLNWYYGEDNLNVSGSVAGLTYDTTGALEASSSGQKEVGITSYLMTEQGIPFADPVTGINVHNGSGEPLPLIQLNLDGSVRTDYSPLDINN